MRKAQLGMLIFLLGSIAQSQAQDQADLEKEKRFHEIYKKYNQSPTSEETWSQSTTGKQENYIIQSGDTLWGVSDTLFADPQYWPKVWSLNSGTIGNPHEVHVKQVVRFTAGTAGEPPSIQLTEATENDRNLVQVTAQEKSVLKDVKIPELETPVKTVLEVPDSLPNWQYKTHSEKEKLIFELDQRAGKFKSAKMSLNYEIRTKEPKAIGEVKETEFGLQQVGETHYVYVQIQKPQIKKYIAVKKIGELDSDFAENKGYIWQMQAELELQELVDAKTKLYRAMVTKSYEPLDVGAMLVDDQVSQFDLSMPANTEMLRGEIIGGQFEEKRLMLSPGQIVFMSGKGYQNGHAYSIFKNREIRIADTDAKSNPLEIGRVKVIRVDGNYVTAVIISANEEILVGDKTNR